MTLVRVFSSILRAGTYLLFCTSLVIGSLALADKSVTTDVGLSVALRGGKVCCEAEYPDCDESVECWKNACNPFMDPIVCTSATKYVQTNPQYREVYCEEGLSGYDGATPGEPLLCGTSIECYYDPLDPPCELDEAMSWTCPLEDGLNESTEDYRDIQNLAGKKCYPLARGAAPSLMLFCGLACVAACVALAHPELHRR